LRVPKGAESGAGHTGGLVQHELVHEIVVADTCDVAQ
jgi:hypothetical protein